MTCSPAEREGHIELVTQLILGVLGQWGGGRVDAIASRGGFLPRPDEKLSGGSTISSLRSAPGKSWLTKV